MSICTETVGLENGEMTMIPVRVIQNGLHTRIGEILQFNTHGYCD